MNTRNQVRLPKKLADAFDTYFQTSRFAQTNFVRFDKTMTLGQVKRLAERYGYTFDMEHATKGKFRGFFKLSGGKRKYRDLRVTSDSLPMAEDWTVEKVDA